jgi:hypothetical protein
MPVSSNSDRTNEFFAGCFQKIRLTCFAIRVSFPEGSKTLVCYGMQIHHLVLDEEEEERTHQVIHSRLPATSCSTSEATSF